MKAKVTSSDIFLLVQLTFYAWKVADFNKVASSCVLPLLRSCKFIFHVWVKCWRAHQADTTICWNVQLFLHILTWTLIVIQVLSKASSSISFNLSAANSQQSVSELQQQLTDKLKERISYAAMHCQHITGSRVRRKTTTYKWEEIYGSFICFMLLFLFLCNSFLLYSTHMGDVYSLEPLTPRTSNRKHCKHDRMSSELQL